MTVSINVAPTTVNTAALAFNQLNAKTVGLPNGGYVVVWQDSTIALAAIRMQQFDALGNPVGSEIPTGLAGSLLDIGLNLNGDIAIAVATGTTLSVQFHEADDLSNLGTAITTVGGSVNSAQLDATTGDSVRVVFTDGTGVFSAAIATPFSGALTSVTQITTLSAGTTIVETVGTSSANVKFNLLSNGAILDTAGASISGGPLTTSTDLMLLQSGLYVVMSSTVDSNVPRLTALFGNVTNAASLTLGSTVVAASIAGSGTLVGATITAREMVDLGEGRILMVWGSFRGTGTVTSVSGIYTSVYNANTGQFEGDATLLRGMGQLSDLQNLTILGSVLEDGRVSVVYSAPNGLTGTDVFTVIVDPRVEGVSMTGTALAETFVGSDFDDSFLAVNLNDTIFGGDGIDTVVLGGATGRQVDLNDPDAFPTGAPRLDGIENVSGNASDDTLFGSAVANRLDGTGGNDYLSGRAGDDTLIGGTGDDTLVGGSDADRLEGGNNNDVLHGGDGNDSLLGGAGNDRALGGTGDDQIQGNDGDDVLNGHDGDDTLLGGIGNDTIITGGGVNLVQAGDGDDLVLVASNGNVIAGEAGSDTVNYARMVGEPLSQHAVHADLTGVPSQFAGSFGFGDFNDELTGVENLIGSGGNDFFAGSASINRLVGGAGDDVLFGREGADTLIGGAGADTFVFDGSGGGNDAVRDFTVGEDTIALALGSFGTVGPENLTARFSANATGAPLANSLAQILFDNDGASAGRLYFDADGNGAGVAVLFATLTFSDSAGLANFGAGDFIFV